MYDFLQSRSRPGGVAKIKIRSLAAVARTFFDAPRNAWGCKFLLFQEVPRGVAGEPRSGCKFSFRKIDFFKTPSAKLTVLQNVAIKQMEFKHN